MPDDGFQGPLREYCPKCEKPVYTNEAKFTNGCKFHPMCWKCTTCNKMLETTTLSADKTELFCKTCYTKKFGIIGNPGAPVKKDEEGKPQVIGGPKIEEGGCPRCGKKVHEAEKRMGGGRDYHLPCFRCKTCSKSLDASNQTERGGEVYCKTCYSKSFSPVGKK